MKVSKVLVVQNKEEWLASWYADDERFSGLPIKEDAGFPRHTFKIMEVADEGC